jgi:hypothetical protein
MEKEFMIIPGWVVDVVVEMSGGAEEGIQTVEKCAQVCPVNPAFQKIEPLGNSRYRLINGSF